MDQFSYSTSFKVRTAASLCYPVVLLGGVGAMFLFVVAPSGGQFRFRHAEWMPLMVLGLLAWCAWEIRAAIQVFSYRLRIDDTAVEVGATRVAWADVVRVESVPVAFGRKPAITLHTRDGKRLVVPGALDGLAFVRSAVEARTPAAGSAPAGA